MSLEHGERRILRDRRKHATPGLSRFTLSGRRKLFRRRSDRERGGYIDHYNAGLFIALILITSLNILDSFFTMLVLDDGGWEVNPIVRSVIDSCGDGFWVWKFFLVSFSLILLALHSNFAHVRAAINALCFIYIAVVLYQMFLITGQLPQMP